MNYATRPRQNLSEISRDVVSTGRIAMRTPDNGSAFGAIPHTKETQKQGG
jgi:hypothetical protein